MKLVSRLLDVETARGIAIGIMSRWLIRSATGQGRPPIPQRIKAFLGLAGSDSSSKGGE
jgi:hypothetical protein